MKNVIILLKIIFSSILSYYLTNKIFPYFEIIDFYKWTWPIVISSVKMNEFWVGVLIMVFIMVLFYWLIPLLILIKINKYVKPFFISKFNSISKISKARSLIHLKNIYSFLFRFHLINPTDAKEEIKYNDYSKGIAGVFSIYIQLFILILIFNLSPLSLIMSLFFLLVLFLSVVISPVILFVSNFIFNLYSDELNRDNK